MFWFFKDYSGRPVFLTSREPIQLDTTRILNLPTTCLSARLSTLPAENFPFPGTLVHHRGDTCDGQNVGYLSSCKFTAIQLQP